MVTVISKIRYIDTSVAFRVSSRESLAAETWLDQDIQSGAQYFSSQLLRTELIWAYRRSGKDLAEAIEFIHLIAMLDLDNELATEATNLEPLVKTLDALHLATALRLAKLLPVTVITHDAQMARAAKQLGLAAHDPVTDDPNRGPVA